MHMRRTNLSPRSSTTVSAVGESFSSVSLGKPCASLHACSQLRHPMHLVTSTRMAFVLSITFSPAHLSFWPNLALVVLPSGTSGQEEFFGQLFPQLARNTRQQSCHGRTAVGCHGRRKLVHHSIQSADVVLHPGSYHRTLHEVALIDRKLGRLHHRDPALRVRIPGNSARILKGVTVHGCDHAFDWRYEVNIGAAATDGRNLLPLANPAVLTCDVDAINFSQEIDGEAVQPHTRSLWAFFEDPGMSRMKAIALRDLEAILALHTRHLCPDARLANGYLITAAHVADRNDQKKHQEDKQDRHETSSANRWSHSCGALDLATHSPVPAQAKLAKNPGGCGIR